QLVVRVAHRRRLSRWTWCDRISTNQGRRSERLVVKLQGPSCLSRAVQVEPNGERSVRAGEDITAPARTYGGVLVEHAELGLSVVCQVGRCRVCKSKLSATADYPGQLQVPGVEFRQGNAPLKRFRKWVGFAAHNFLT